MTTTIMLFAEAFSKATGQNFETINDMLNDLSRRLPDTTHFNRALQQMTVTFTPPPKAVPSSVKKTPAKRAKSAWLFFCDAKKAETKAELTGKSGSLMAVLGAKWKSLSEKDKEPYKRLAAEAKDGAAEKDGASPMEVEPEDL